MKVDAGRRGGVLSLAISQFWFSELLPYPKWLGHCNSLTALLIIGKSVFIPALEKCLLYLCVKGGARTFAYQQETGALLPV